MSKQLAKKRHHQNNPAEIYKRKRNISGMAAALGGGAACVYGGISVKHQSVRKIVTSAAKGNVWRHRARGNIIVARNLNHPVGGIKRRRRGCMA